MSTSPHVIETTAERFEADVLERSKSVPVVVDFWAAWCQPCRMLGPLLERAAEQAAGQFVLVKADVDQLPQHAAAFGVQGIPAVFAVRDGKVVDSFAGLLTEPQLAAWLKAIVPSEAQRLVKEAAALEATDASTALAKYRQAAELDARLPDAQIGAARMLLATGHPEDARKVIEQLEARGFLEPDAQRLKAQLDMSAHRVSEGDLAGLRQQAAASPKDSALKLQLAEALLAAGQFDEGLALCLEIVAADRGPLRDKARQAMLDAFRILGDDQELTRDMRRKLAMALY